MYNKCPKCGYERKPHDDPNSDMCPACGIIISKYLQHQNEPPEVDSHKIKIVKTPDSFKERLLTPKEDVSSAEWVGRFIIWGLFAAWGLYFIFLDFESNKIGASFMHRVDLVFHEAGHWIFRILGEFMGYAGGSLMQLIVPAVPLFLFVYKYGDNFAGSIMLWWFAQSLMDLAPYIDDARRMALPLLGGGTGMDRPGMHDWNYLLGKMGLLEHERGIAIFVDVSGEVLMWTAIIWGLAVLMRQRRALNVM